MFLSALALAAALQAAPLVEMPAAPPVQLPPPRTANETRGAKQLKAWQAKPLETWQARMEQIAKCRGYRVERARGAAAEPPASTKILARRSPGLAKRMGELPPAHGERAVLRTVDGCAVSTPIVARMDAPQP